MAQAGFTPISIYYSTTAAAAPTAGNLVPGELAINITDGKLYYEDNLGAVQVIATKAGANGDVVGPASSTANAIARFSGTTGKIIQNSGITIDASNNVTGMGTLSSGAITSSSLTSGRVLYAGTSGLIQDSANLTFNGTTLTANTIGAFTLGGTISGGGNQINNIVIGASTPLAGSFTTLSASGVATFSAGTVSAPAITTTGDLNTGIFFPAADTIAFAEGGAEAMRIDSSGRVGIGETNPTNALQVKRTSGASIIKTQTTDTASYSSLDAQSDSGSGTLYRFGSTYSTSGQYIASSTLLESSAGTLSLSSANAEVRFYTGNSERMRIDSSGNVIVGGTAALNSSANRGNISIRGSSGAILNFGSASAELGYIFHDGTNMDIRCTTNGYMAFDTNNTERMRINSSGAVGIGTNNPLAQLHVVGAVSNIMQILDAGSSRNMYFGNDGNGFYGEWNADTGARSQIRFQTRNSGAGTYSSIQIDGGNQLLKFNTNDTERARITSGGYFKASNDGTYRSSTLAFHEFRNSDTAYPCLVVNSTSGSFANQDVFQIVANRGTTNNTFYAASYYNDATGTYKWRVADSGNVTNTNGSYGTISDAKLKQDIVDAGSQWDDIKNLRFRKYRLKSEVELDPNAKPFLGLVAQEAELVSPGLIEEHKDTKQEIKTREVEKTREIPAVLDDEGNEVTPAITETYTETEEYTETVDLGTTTKSIKTSILYMKAVKALQEAMTRIEALEAEVAALKGQ